MSRAAPLSDPCSIALLLFRVGRVRFAIEAGQVASMAPFTSSEGEEALPFHRIVGYGDAEIPCRAPTVLSLRRRGGRALQIVIDAPEEIAEFAWSDIVPLPPLLEPLALRRGIWGVLRLGEEMVLLVDADRWTEEAKAQGEEDGRGVPPAPEYEMEMKKMRRGDVQ